MKLHRNITFIILISTAWTALHASQFLFNENPQKKIEIKVSQKFKSLKKIWGAYSLVSEKINIKNESHEKNYNNNGGHTLLTLRKKKLYLIKSLNKNDLDTNIRVVELPYERTEKTYQMKIDDNISGLMDYYFFIFQNAEINYFLKKENISISSFNCEKTSRNIFQCDLIFLYQD